MLTVAAVQMPSRPYRVDENLEKAEGYLRRASAEGAQVVVLPELFSTGYCYSARNFEAAEAISGRTARWFRSMGKRFAMFVAGAMIEKDRGRYYDTMVLGTPEGRIVSYRKRRLAMQEKCYFTAGDYPLIIYTELGRIGTGICADLLDRRVWERYRDKVDLLIVPSAWADFTAGRMPFARTPLNRRITGMTRELPRRLAASLGAPVVYANLCGPFNSSLPLLYPFEVGGEFAGNSSIHDAEGRRVSGLEKEEGLVLSRLPITDRSASSVSTVRPGAYWIEPSVRLAAWADRTLFALPCALHRRWNQPR